MGKYDDLLEEVKRKATAFQSVAKKYIPRMYEDLRNEILISHHKTQESELRKTVLIFGVSGLY